jgi:hypothetical protein
MTPRKRLVALLATVGSLVFAANASAAFPNYSGCPSTTPGVIACIDVQSTAGNLRIKEFNVPLHESLEIRGGLMASENGRPAFVPARGTNGFIGTPVPVPGGLLGINFPIPGNSVLAIAELAGPSSAIQIVPGELNIRVPVKVRLVNVLLGMDCRIGTNSRPVNLDLIVGTTSPPPPNRPITGSPGEVTQPEERELRILNSVNVENSFSVPGATECGLGLGLINALVNAKLRIPSAAGNNAIEVHNNTGLRFL